MGVDAKHDLNADRAPVITMVVDDCRNGTAPIAFALCNKENNLTIGLAITSVQHNLPCDRQDCDHRYHYEDLASGKGIS